MGLKKINHVNMDKVDIWSKIVVMLKNCLTHKILMKEKEKDHYL